MISIVDGCSQEVTALCTKLAAGTKMRTVITYGTFDMFHVGHLRLIKRMSELAERVIVAVSTDEFNALKGKQALLPYEERCEIIAAIKYVDLVIEEHSWDQKTDDIVTYNVDLFVIGDDWLGKFDCLSRLCLVRYLERTQGISSSAIRLALGR